MSVAKPEVPTSQLVGEIATKFQRLQPYFRPTSRTVSSFVLRMSARLRLRLSIFGLDLDEERRFSLTVTSAFKVLLHREVSYQQ